MTGMSTRRSTIPRAKAFLRDVLWEGGSLCQDEVIVQFTSPAGNRSMGVRDDDTQRRQVALLQRGRSRR